jgi:hypothetical protein
MQCQPVVAENPAPLWDRTILDVFRVDTSHLFDIPSHLSALSCPPANAHGIKLAETVTATKAAEAPSPPLMASLCRRPSLTLPEGRTPRYKNLTRWRRAD